MGKVENKIIVWSIDDFNTLGLMRELGNFQIQLAKMPKMSNDKTCNQRTARRAKAERFTATERDLNTANKQTQNNR